VEATFIGGFRDDGHLLLRYGDTLVAELETRFLHRGRPVSVLPARWDPPQSRASLAGEREDHAETLLHLLADGTIGSKESVVRRYDHEVGARTAIGPLVGNAGPSDGVVLRPLENSPRGVVIGLGMAPRATALDPYGMAFLAVDEALRNLVAAGGSIGRAALLDNFCWGDVDDPVALGTLVRAAQGCRDAAMRYRVPFISGKDSLRNTSTDATGRHSIPGTLVITAIGVVPNAGHCVTMAPTGPGDTLYLLGTTDGALGGSYHASLRGSSAGDLPRARPETAALMRRLTRAMRRGLISACHDLSEGGLAVAAAEMAIAGGVGISLDLCGMPAETDDLDALLFCETPGRFLLTVCEADRSRFERCMGAAPLAPLGETTREQRVLLRHGRESAIDLPLTAVEAAWRGAL
jgi:phosphoribosylformylglycinamidine synthase